MKDFDKWNIIKKKTEDKDKRPKIKLGDVYWCRLGLNIGFEQDGKNDNYKRPVVVIKKYTQNVVFVLPLTTKLHNTDWYFDIYIKGESNQVILNQGKTIDTKRFEKFIVNLPENKIHQIKSAFVKLFNNDN